MNPSIQLPFFKDLLKQDFYRGQIVKTLDLPGAPPKLVPASIIAGQSPRLAKGSLPPLLKTLGLPSVYATTFAALRNAFGEEEDRDCLLVSPRGAARDYFWLLAALLEALDEARVCLVVAPDEEAAQVCEKRLQQIVDNADISYALTIYRFRNETEAHIYQTDFPSVVILELDSLRRLVLGEFSAELNRSMLGGSMRVVLPDIDDWSVPLASHAVWFFRLLHLDAASAGTNLSLLATASPASGLLSHISDLWGRTLPGSAIIVGDSEESVPATALFYGSPLERDADSSYKRWVRGRLDSAAFDLVNWLVQPHNKDSTFELHYVIDISVSMDSKVGDQHVVSASADISQRLDQRDPDFAPRLRRHLSGEGLNHLDVVVAAVLRDLDRRQKKGHLDQVERVRITIFDTDAELLADWDKKTGEDLVNYIEDQLLPLESKGGTDIARGLTAAFDESLNTSGSGHVEFILLSDGGSLVSEEDRSKLLASALAARGRGQTVRLIWVAFEASASLPLENLVHQLDGKIIRTSIDEMDSIAIDSEGMEKDMEVVYLHGEGGLPPETFAAAVGKRRLISISHGSLYFGDPRKVAAVVASGQFANFRAIRDQVRHWGNGRLQIYVLVEAEASSKLLYEDFGDNMESSRILSLQPANPAVVAIRLAEAVRSHVVGPDTYRYLTHGGPFHDAMVKEWESPPVIHNFAEGMPDPPPGFSWKTSGGRPILALEESTDLTKTRNNVFSAFDPVIDRQITLQSAEGTTHVDRHPFSLFYFRGAFVPTKAGGAVVEKIDDSRIALVPYGLERCHPWIDQFHIQPVDEAAMNDSRRLVPLGEFSYGSVKVHASLGGFRRFRLGTLDDHSPKPDRYPQPIDELWQAPAMRWLPASKPASEVLVALANILRLTIKTRIRHADRMILIYPDLTEKCIWFAETSSGGNGYALRLFNDNAVVETLLRLGGRLALDCPCETGLAATHDGQPLPSLASDSGCPRCTRFIGLGIATSHGSDDDLFARVNKKTMLEWLLDRGLLPGSGPKHLSEKYPPPGVEERERITRAAQGSRKGFEAIARRIFEDRLGLSMDDATLPPFEWADVGEQGTVSWAGLYNRSSNLIKMQKFMPEWSALNVYCHEFFHCLQFQTPGLFNPALEGGDIPMGGKLFIEGAAVWAESHLADALAIRTALETNNLRDGDEYGEGFQIIKWIEENHGGVAAVLRFLETGDIAAVSKGTVRDLHALYRKFGVEFNED